MLPLSSATAGGAQSPASLDVAPLDDGSMPGREFTDHQSIRRSIFDNVLASARRVPSYDYGNYRLQLSDLDYEGPEHYDKSKQKRAILEGGTLHRRLRGTLSLLDRSNNKVLAQKKLTLANVPYYTPRGTFIFNGTEYAVANQLRLQPGIYTRMQENGQLESHVNVLPGKGFSHRYHLEPETGIFKLAVGQSNLPLMPLLRAAGISDKQMREAWGEELYRNNLLKNDPRILDKLYAKLVRNPDTSLPAEERHKALADLFLNMEVDPEVTRRTLGAPYRKLDQEAMLATTKKLLAVARGEDEDDDRDHLAYQRVIGPEDLLSESFNKAYTLFRPLLWKAARTGNLDHVTPGLATKLVQSGILDSGLANPVEEVNVLDLLDAQTRISRMGRGSIGSIDAIPDSARAVHPSQLGYLDTVRTGECYAEDMEVLTRLGYVRWPDVKEDTDLACLVDGELAFHPPLRLQTYDYDGVLYGADNYRVAYLVTPNHRMWVSPVDQSLYHFDTAEEIHLCPRQVLYFERTQGSILDAEHYFTRAYSGKVYCATVPGGLLCVKRGNRLGFWCGNSLKAGVDLRTARNAVKGHDGQLYGSFLDAKTGKTVWRSPRQLADATVAFADEMKTNQPLVNALVKGQFAMVPRSDVDYVQPSFESGFNALANLIPLKNSSKGQRIAMGARFLQQAVPLKEPQAALVATKVPGSDKTFDELYAEHAGVVRAKTGGRVLSVTPDYVDIRYDDGTQDRVELYNNHVLNRKTLIHNTLVVQAGDRVEPDQLLARSNYSDEKGRLALGANFRTAYLANSENYEDAFVISESAAKRMTSEHAYQHTHEWDDSYKRGKKAFLSLFPTVFDRKTMDTLDDDGVVKPGTVVQPGQPLILLAKQKELNHKQIHSTHKSPFTDQSVLWDHHDAGVVTDVAKTAKGLNVVVKSYAPMQVGDKMSGLYGDKGVVSRIIPDEHMPHDEQGRPFEILANPNGVISRGNPSQVVVGTLGKIADKRGERYVVEDASLDDNTDYGLKEADKHGVADTETVIDPRTGKKIPGVYTGMRYYLKLHHMAAAKGSARGLGSYTAEQTPARGSGEGAQAKKVALMDVNSLLSHGALQVIKDNKLIRGNQNLEYWTDFMAGNRPASPSVPFIYRKFIEHLKGSGINVIRQGSRNHLLAMTNQDLEELTGDRELRNAETVDWRDGMKPIPGGLFDPTLTGGHQGGRFAKITLHEPMPSPVMEEPIRKVLGLTQQEFEDVLAGKKELDGSKGPQAVAAALDKIDLDRAIESARAAVASGRKTLRDDAVKKLGFLKTCKDQGIHPRDWVLKAVPVLPPLFRPVSIMQGSGGTLVADPNYLYKDLFDANEALKELSKEVDDVSGERVNLYNAFKAVVGLGDPVNPKHVEKRVQGLLGTVFGNSPKTSIVQSKLIGTPVNTVSRGVVIPDPDLHMDEVGIPESFAWTMYAPFIVRRLVRQGVSRIQAVEYLNGKTPLARKALLEAMDDGPVVLTRAPVLHRWGHMAFWPRLTKGDVIRVSPPVVTGLGMDFDGDAQFDHVFCSIDKSCLTDFNSCAKISKVAHLSETYMPFAKDETTCFSGGADVCMTHLESFPHGKLVDVSNGQFGPIEWYEVPEGIRTLSYNDVTRTWEWRQVALWSKHYGMPVQIVNLRSGRQIFTDDDPRAVYGIEKGTLQYGRRRPSEAVRLGMIVPRLHRLHAYPGTVENWIVGDETTGSMDRLVMRREIPLNENTGYVLGVIAGDGWAEHFQDVPRAVAVAGISDEVIAKLDALIPEFFIGQAPQRYSVVSKESKGESRRHVWNSVQFGRAIATLLGRKAQNKRLPAWFLSAPKAFRKGLFAGLMDTDGSISVSNGKAKPQLMANFSSASLRLCQEVVLLAASLDIRGRITSSKTPAGEPFWMVGLSNSDIQRYDGKYMAHADKLTKLRSVPTIEMTGQAVRNDIIPISYGLAAVCATSIAGCVPGSRARAKGAKNDPTRSGIYYALITAKQTGVIPRETVRRFMACEPSEIVKAHPDWNTFTEIFSREDVTWDPVESFEDTGITHTGYDLTVPGTETFVNASGVVLSNTSNIHIPVSDEAKKEAAAKMLPSRNLIAASDLRSTMYFPRQEYQAALYALSTENNKGKRPQVFATMADLQRAYENGQIDAGDPVEVLKRE